MLDALYARLQQQVPFGHVTLMGDSAGGGFALDFAMMLRDAGEQQSEHILLLSPWPNLTVDNSTQEALDVKDPLLARPALVRAAEVGQWDGTHRPAHQPGVRLTGQPIASLFVCLVRKGNPY